ncbi:Gnat domain, partial [Globisporangium splendens]
MRRVQPPPRAGDLASQALFPFLIRGRLKVPASDRIRYAFRVLRLQVMRCFMAFTSFVLTFYFRLVGDSPIGMGRWRISQDVDGVAGSTTVVVIEQFGILASKRQQGYGTKFLRRIVEDVSSKLTQMRLRVPALVAYARDTNETALPAVNVFQACGFALDPQRHGTSDMSYLRLSLTKSAESTSE